MSIENNENSLISDLSSASKVKARREAILNILPTNKEKALNINSVYDELTRKNPEFMVQFRGESSYRQLRTIERDLKYLVSLFDIGCFKDSRNLYSGTVLNGLSDNEWVSYAKKIHGEDRKAASAELKNEVITIVESHRIKGAAKTEWDYRDTWRGKWRYFKVGKNDENKGVGLPVGFIDKQSLIYIGKVNDLKGSLNSEEFHSRLINALSCSFVPNKVLLDHIRVISKAILNSNRVALYIPSELTRNKRTKQSVYPLGILNNRGKFTLVAYQIVGNRWDCRKYDLSEMEEVMESNEANSLSLSSSEINDFLNAAVTGDIYAESASEVSLYLYNSAASKFSCNQRFVGEEIIFEWVNKTEKAAKVTFTSMISECLVEELVALGGNVIVEGPEELKQRVADYQTVPNKFAELIKSHKSDYE